MLLDTITQQIPRFERISTGVNFYHGDTLTQALGQSLTLLPLFLSSSLNSSLHKHKTFASAWLWTSACRRTLIEVWHQLNEKADDHE